MDMCLKDVLFTFFVGGQGRLCGVRSGSFGFITTKDTLRIHYLLRTHHGL